MLSIEQINKLEQENKELKKQIESQKGLITVGGKQQYEYLQQLNELYQEIERLKAECDMYKTFYRAKHSDIKGLLFKYKQTLQGIKAIAEKPKSFKDFSEIKTATEVEYDYAAICNELELRLHKVLELITKAEEE